MRWEDGRRSENVEDRRGMRAPRGGMRLGLGSVAIALVAGYFLGINPLTLLGALEGAGGVAANVSDSGSDQSPPLQPGQDPAADFVAVVLGDTEDTWTEIFASAGAQYEPPRLVLFTDAVRSACGIAESAMGPFYCPTDRKVYIDLGFYRDLRDRFGAPGDFAQAYVIAHEVGHHVQNLMGTAGKVHEAQQQGPQALANALSVRLELQADCYAGVWANHADKARSVLEQGDVEEGLNAAAAIGDDRIQRQTQGHVVPESFTHGSSEQRVRWFKRGLESGDLRVCDTFSERGA
jgi:hypothetical protein